MDDEMQIFQFLAAPLGFAMRWIYMLLLNYGWTIILFTVLVRLIMFPLSLKQQKSTARTSAYQPMIQEIQKKWANDKNRQNQEMQKFQEENNIKMTAGCLPSIVNMLVMFGIIAVIQAPLSYILRIPETEVQNTVAIVQHYDPESAAGSAGYTQQSLLIGEIRSDPEKFTTGVDVTSEEGEVTHVAVDSETVQAIRDFKFDFAGLNLASVPRMSDFASLILPLLSVITMFASQIIITFTSGQTQGRTMMLVMTVAMGAFFGWYAFTIPVGFSLYYTISNVVMTVQQLIVRKIYDPAKIRAEVEAEIEERKKAKKAKKQVKVRGDAGMVETKELTDAELAQLRLARARELDAQRYEEEEAEAREALEKAREADEEKYGKGKTGANKREKEVAGAVVEEIIGDIAKEAVTEGETITPDEAVEKAAAIYEESGKQEQEKKQPGKPKPGRRKRARQNKEKTAAQPEEKSFVQTEMEQEG